MVHRQKQTRVDAALSPGASVDHYRILRLLGHGGMGEVYLARDTQLGRKVALKLIREDALADTEAKDRFLHEARITAQFNHPNIITIFSVGKHGDNPYVALEYLEGNNLRQRLKEGAIAYGEGIRIGLAIAGALTEAHDNGVLHRDLKPENISIPTDGRLRVLDFGLAKLVSAADPAVGHGESARPVPAHLDEGISAFKSQFQGLRGTPAYMAPEQWRQQELTPAADVWALGLVLYELFTGAHPLGKARKMSELVALATDPDPLPSLASKAAELPRPLVELVDECLRKTPADRPTAAWIVKRLERLQPGAVRILSQDSSPFRGLQAFDEEHANLFFGRDAEIAAFMERLRGVPVLPVVGPSGAGKSSFVQAGVIPRLREQGPWQVLHLRPGEHPFRSLARQIVTAEKSLSHQPPAPRASVQDMGSDDTAIQEAPGREPVSGDSETILGTDETAMQPQSGASPAETVVLAQPLAETLDAHSSLHTRTVAAGATSSSTQPPPNAEAISAELAQHPNKLALLLSHLAEQQRTRVLLFVDQLEELETQTPDPVVRKAFMRAICIAADDPESPVRVIFTLRDDFLGRLAESDEAQHALGQSTILRIPGREALVETLVRPLELAGYSYDPEDLPHRMVADVQGELAALPLLQFAAQMLWEQRERETKTLTQDAFDTIGGVAGALAGHADGLLSTLSNDQLDAARQMFIRLVDPEGTRRVVSRELLLDGLPSTAETVLDRLTDARIIVVRKNEDGASLEIVHESLIRTWDRLRRWLLESDEERLFLAEASQAADLWSKRGQSAKEVWQGDALREALAKASRCAVLPRKVELFLKAGERADRSAALRKRIIWTALIVGLGIVTAASVVVALVIREKQKEAERERKQARIQRDSAVKARRKAEDRQLEAQLEGARAAAVRGNILEARAKLRNALELRDTPTGRKMWFRLRNHPLVWREKLCDVISRVTYSPDRKHLAVACGKRLKLITVKKMRVRELKGHKATIWSIVFSNSGRYLLSASQDRTVRVWNVPRGTIHRVLRGHSGICFSLAVSPDDRLIASGSGDKTIKLWNLKSGTLQTTIPGHEGTVTGLAFDQTGKLLAAGTTENRLLVRDITVSPPRVVTAVKQALPQVLRFGPRGRFLAVTGGFCLPPALRAVKTGRLVRVFDAITRGQSRPLLIRSMALSHDGTHLVLPSCDRSIQIWHTRTGRLVGRLPAGAKPYSDIALSPDSELLVTAGADGYLQLWNMRNAIRQPVYQRHEGDVLAVAISADGKHIASGGSDGMVLMWDAESGRVTRALAGSASGTSSLKFSRNAELLAAGGRDGVIRVWKVISPVSWRATKLEGHRKSINAIAFADKGKRLLSASEDGTVGYWNLDTKQRLFALKGHAGPVFSVATGSHDHIALSGGRDSTIRVWNLKSGALIKVIKTPWTVRSLELTAPNRIRVTGKYLRHALQSVYSLTTGRSLGMAASTRMNSRCRSTEGRTLAKQSGGGLCGKLAWIFDLRTKRLRFLQGHRAEVLAIAVSSDGRRIVTGSADGTVRLWEGKTGRPIWRAPMLSSHRGAVFTHSGWKRPGERSRPAKPKLTRWQMAIQTRARVSDQLAGTGSACLVTHRNRLELWSLGADKRVAELEVGPIAQIAASPGACAVLTGGSIKLYEAKGSHKTLIEKGAETLGRTATRLWAGVGNKLIWFDGHGKKLDEQPVSALPTAVYRTRKWLVIGERSGGIGLLPLRTFNSRSPINLKNTPRCPVLRLTGGPSNTLIAGYACGVVAMWDLDNGLLLRKERVHGPVRLLQVTKLSLRIFTELGHYRVISLLPFSQTYCTLLHEVQKLALAVWLRGKLTINQSLPAGHRCRGR